jgi:hypothetical protein
VEKHTPQSVNVDRNGNQAEESSGIFESSSATIQIDTPIPRLQPVEPSDPGPGPDEGPLLRIFLNSPANNATFSGFASQGGVTITASGSVLAERYTVNSVEVSFDNSTVSLPARSGSWTCTSNKITDGGSLTISARVTGNNTKPNISDTQTDSTRVTVVMTDDIPPAVTIAGVTVAEEPNGKYTAVLKGTATDNMSGIKKLDYIVDGNFTNVPTIPTVFLPNWETNVPLDFAFGHTPAWPL